MSSFRPYLRSSFVLGLTAFVVPGYFIARSAWTRHHPLLSITIVVLFAALNYALMRWEARTGSASTTHFPWLKRLGVFLLGVFLAWGLVLLGGSWQYARARSKVDASGYLALVHADDPVDKSLANGRMHLDAWDASPERTALFRQVSGERVLRELIGDTLKAASGHGGDLRAAMAKLRPKRSQWGVALKHLDRAQKAPKFSWNIAYSAPIWDMDIPKFSGSLDLARVASAEALFLAAEGKSNEAEARLAQVLWLADRYAGAGAVVPVLASVAIDHFVWTAATPLFAAGKGQGLTEAKVVDLRLALKRALALEFLHGPPSVRGMSSISLTAGTDLDQKFVSIYTPWLDWDISAGLRDNLDLLRCLEFPGAADTSSCMGKRLDRIEQEGWLLQSMGYHGFQNFPLKIASAMAKRDLARLALAAGLWRKAKGRWPRSLGEMGMNVVAGDPYTGAPYQIGLVDGTLEIRCLGANGRADGSEVLEEEKRDWYLRL